MIWVCLYFPQLALDLYNQAHANTPLVIEQQISGKRLVYLANQAATDAGITTGQSISNAYALSDLLVIKTRDIHLEKQAIQQLATLAYQFSPSVTVYDKQRLLLEISGCLHLFKGAIALLETLETQLSKRDFVYHIGIAHTASAACAFAAKQQPYENTLHSINNHKVNDADFINLCTTQLHTLNLDFLAFDDKARTRMQGMGLTTLKQLSAIPHHDFKVRFGAQNADYLSSLFSDDAQHITHHSGEALALFKPKTVFDHEIPFSYEISNKTALSFPIKNALQALGSYLQATQQSLIQYTIDFHHRDKSVSSLSVTLSKPHFQWEKLLSVTLLKLEKMSFQKASLALSIHAENFMQLHQVTTDLFAKNTCDTEHLSDLVDRLQAKLGQGSVYSVEPNDEHRPENAWRKVSTSATSKQTTSPPINRPLWLLKKPQRLNTSQHDQPVYEGLMYLMQGPERIKTGWWDQQTINRDYYIAQHQQGRFYWVYQDRNCDQHWYLHGIFA